MQRKIILNIFCFLFLLVFPFCLHAEDDVVAQIKALQAQIDLQKQQIAKQEAMIQALQKTVIARTAAPAAASQSSSQKLDLQAKISGPAVSEITSSASDQRARDDVAKSSISKLLPDISAIGSMTASVFRDDPGENGHDPERTGFNLQEIELGIQSIVDPYVKADIFLAFHEEGVELEEGYLTTLSLPSNLQIRAGKMKLPFGRQNQKHLETWSFINENLINSRIFGGEGFNELAFVPSILFPTPFFLQLEAGVSQGENENNFDGTSKAALSYLARLSASWDLAKDLTILIGGSGAFGSNNTGDDQHTQIYGGDMTLKWKPSRDRGITFESEYIGRRRHVPGDLQSEGGVSSALIGQWSKRWQAGLRFDYDGFPENVSHELRFSPMLRFMPSEFFSLRAQYDFDKVEDKRVNHAGHLQATFNVGPHGAHKF